LCLLTLHSMLLIIFQIYRTKICRYSTFQTVRTIHILQALSNEFKYDVFLSHGSKDKADVRAAAERLRKDGLKVWFDEWAIKIGDSISAKIEKGLELSRVLVLFMSANAFCSDWAQLEAGTFRFRDPLNKECRFIPVKTCQSVFLTKFKRGGEQRMQCSWFQKTGSSNIHPLARAE